MTVIGFFMLSAGLLATLWAGKVELLVAVVIWFVAAVVTDLTTSIADAMTKYLALRNVEVVLNGMAEGQAPDGLRNQVWNTARKAWSEAEAKRNEGKGD